MRTTTAVRYVGLFSLAAISSCATQSGPKPRPAQPIAVANIAAPVAPNDPALLAYLRVHDLWALLGKLDLQTTVSAAAQGFRFVDLRAGGVTAAFAWDPAVGKSIDHSPAYLVLPTPTTSPVAMMVQALIGAATPVGSGAGFSVNPRAPASAVDLKDLARLTEQPINTDVEIFYNIESFLQRHREDVNKAIDSVFTKSAKQNSKMLAGTMQTYLGMFERWKTLAINFAVDPEQFEISLVTQSKQANAPRTSTDLSRFVDDGDFDLRYEMSPDPSAVGWYAQFYESLFIDAEPALKAKMAEMFKAQIDAMVGSHVAATFHFADARVHGTLLSQLQPGKDLMTAMRQSVLMMNDPEMQKLYASLGSKTAMSVKSEPAARSTLGHKIDHYEFAQRSITGLPPSKEDIAPVVKEWSADVVQVGPYFIYALNETPAALDRVITALVQGTPLRSASVGGAELFFDGKINIGRSVNAIVASMPKYASKVGKLDDALPLITFDGAEVGALTRYRVRVPRKVVSAVTLWFQQVTAAFRGPLTNEVPVEPSDPNAMPPKRKSPHK